ncbi:unnamed protein product [Phytomonas sp. EM1]|nr:unnamed protein product [Phytomonas sp. EM1]|eukprot:CCW61073.1 unnamed protein product [Phytomonas sp. isolate EM1]
MSEIHPNQHRISAARVDQYVRQLCLDESSAKNGAPRTVEFLLQRVFSDLFGDKHEPILPDCMPFAIKQVPALAEVALRQARIATRVCAAVSTRPVVTVYELQEEICLEERVASFRELGFGESLGNMPIVQQYFNLKPNSVIYPVRSRHLMEFILYHPESRRILDSSGDTRDVINSFKSYYESKILPALRETHPELFRSGPLSRKARTLSSNRELGIHIQSLPWLLMSLRQEADGAVLRLFENICEDAKARIDKNKEFYLDVIRAMDESLMRRGVSGSDGLPHTFSVQMSETKARRTTLPSTLWKSCETDGSGNFVSVGGVSVAVRLGDPEIPPPVREIQQDTVETIQTTPPSTVPPSRLRRRIIKEASTTLLDEGEGGRGLPLPPSTSNPAFSLPFAISGEKAVVDPPSLAISTVEERLKRMLAEAGEGSLSGWVELLRGIPPGSRLPRELFVACFTRLLREGGASSAEDSSAFFSTPFIPLLRECEPSGVVEVLLLATPAEVCWEASKDSEGDASDVFSPSPALFHASLAGFYGPSLKSFFCDQLGVSEGPNTLSWFLSMRVNHRRFSPWEFEREGLRARSLRMLALCVKEDYARRVARFTKAPRSSSLSFSAEHPPPPVGALALDELLSSLPEAAARSAWVFPFHGLWCRGIDDLFLASPRHWGVSELYVKPIQPSNAPGLRAIPAEEEPHFAVAALLRRSGVRLLDEHLVQRVSFDTLALSNDAGRLHRSIALIVPYLQTFLCRRDRAWYEMIYDRLSERLRSFRVVLGRQSALLEGFWHENGIFYASSREPLKLCYLAVHNTLYGEEGVYTPQVLASAVVELFLPLFTTVGFREELRGVVESFLLALSAVEGVGKLEQGYRPTDRPEEISHKEWEEALKEIAYKLQLKPFCEYVDTDLRMEGGEDRRTDESTTGSATSRDPRPSYWIPWTVSATPPERCYSTFPPGCDGFSLPSLSFNSPNRQAGRGPPALGSSSIRGGPPIHSRMSSSPQSFIFNRKLSGARITWDDASFMADITSGGVRRRRLEAGSEAVENDGESNSTRANLTRPGVHEDSDDSDDDPTEEEVIRFTYPSRKRGLDTTPSHLISSSASGGRTADDVDAYATAAERFVFQALKAQYEGVKPHGKTTPSVEVVWVNEHGESGMPYDIVLLNRGQSCRGGAHHAEDRPKPVVKPAVAIPSSNSSLRNFYNTSPSTRQNTTMGFCANETNTGNFHQQSGKESAINPHSPNEYDVLEYIEVKSTSSNNRTDFELSLREFILAAKHGPAFKVYRVFKASTSTPGRMHFKVYSDLVRLWITGKLTISGNIRVLPSS